MYGKYAELAESLARIKQELELRMSPEEAKKFFASVPLPSPDVHEAIIKKASDVTSFTPPSLPSASAGPNRNSIPVQMADLSLAAKKSGEQTKKHK